MGFAHQMPWVLAAGRMPLHMAAIGGHPDTIAFLLEKGVWTDAYDAHDDTALHIAARSDNLQQRSLGL